MFEIIVKFPLCRLDFDEVPRMGTNEKREVGNSPSIENRKARGSRLGVDQKPESERSTTRRSTTGKREVRDYASIRNRMDRASKRFCVYT